MSHQPINDRRVFPLSQPDDSLVESLAGLNASPDLKIALRARRAVRNAAGNLRADRDRKRRNIGLTLMLAVGFLMLLTPALWSGVDEIFAGAHIFDLSLMTTLLALTLLSAIVAALVAGWKNQQQMRTGRRNF